MQFGLLFSNQTDHNFEVNFLDVGQGDSILLTTPNKKLILIDGGPKTNPEPLNTINSKSLFSSCEIELLVITHPHSDHTKGLLDIFDSCEVLNIVMTNQLYESDIYESVVESMVNEDSNIKLAQNTDLISIDGVNLQILWPKSSVDESPGIDCDYVKFCENKCKIFQDLVGQVPYTCDNPNLDSIVLLVSYNDFDILLTADAENEILENLDINNVEVLKVPHQGSVDSLNIAFLEKVKPLVGVISVGKNTYGHPSPKVLGEYDNRNIKMLRTDENGNVVVKSDGKDFWVE